MRSRFVSDLTKDLLGPRRGSEEILPSADEPKNEYLIGQLHPLSPDKARIPEDDAEILAATDGGEEDNEDEVVNSTSVDSGRNFRRIPSSFGISFVLRDSPQKDDFRICVSWARYSLAEDGNWKRTPRYLVASFDPDRDQFEDERHELFLNIKVTPLRDGRTKVTVYIGSRVQPARMGIVGSADIIFQPELRIRLKRPESLAELGSAGFTSDDPEWKIATRQYSHLGVLARGHLCGAYWRTIDPQQNVPMEPPQSSPFVWVDGHHFLAQDESLHDFLNPDLRTDFLPMYSAPAPSFEWDPRWSPAPTLSARRLSECTDRASLRGMTAPLAQHYRTWIEELRSNIVAGNPLEQTDREICKRHDEALRRIIDGIEFLMHDSSAFITFLFMNKAMDLQAGWARGNTDEMLWRPFQLAFILMTIRSTVTSVHEREICDIIWFPTGGGKTEAYLGLTAFACAYRRLTSKPDHDGHRGGDGTAILSRYTLRLLTIQQFRRALRMIAACEVLRLRGTDGRTGWRPNGVLAGEEWIWGRSPFSIGLWVGGTVTPNRMEGKGWGDSPSGALYLLSGYPKEGEADPAQIINCPCCRTILSLPVEGLQAGDHEIHFYILGNPNIGPNTHEALSTNQVKVHSVSARRHPSGKVHNLSLHFSFDTVITPAAFQRWWAEVAERLLGVQLASFNASRPGYIRIQGGRQGKTTDYEIRCPNPECDLNKETYREKTPASQGRWAWTNCHPLFHDSNDTTRSFGIPIRAITVDEKLYAFPPTMVVSTCDKIANTAWTEEAATLFGHARSYNPRNGFSQASAAQSRASVPFNGFLPPMLVIQDELHLLEGPLGSMFGLYESAVDYLCSRPKYIASSATIRNAAEQVSALMARSATVFPPVSTDVSGGFFLRVSEAHPLDEGTTDRKKAGRLFLGLAFPGRATQTPMLRIWGRLLQTAKDLQVEGADETELDYFWTLIGYFNAIRELAAGESLWRQDIPQYLDKLASRGEARERRVISAIKGEGFQNLSSQTASSALPGILSSMERGLPQGDALDAVATTSMFGTGVDVTRLSMMVIHGQPKSASAYIQAVGRIGRERAGLAVVFFRVSKPRDLNHYEYFTGYHRRLPVSVEPITVKPLAPRAIDRVLGPLIVVLLRNARAIAGHALPTSIESEEGGILAHHVEPEIWVHLRTLFQDRWNWQPERRRPVLNVFLDYVSSKIERWQEFSRRRESRNEPLKYDDGQVAVLGGSDNTTGEYVYPNTPKSLREVEAVIKIHTERE